MEKVRQKLINGELKFVLSNNLNFRSTSKYFLLLFKKIFLPKLSDLNLILNMVEQSSIGV
jgi:hypothetical protein